MKRRQALKITSIGAIGLSASISSSCSKNTYSFNHGVASGDPLEDRVILWTRVTPQQAGPVEAILEISEDENFSKIAYSKKLRTSSLSDYTIKYDFLAKQYCDSDNGFICNKEVYTGAGKDNSEIPQLGVTGNLVARLLKSFSAQNY